MNKILNKFQKAKPILQYDLEGNFIANYPSARQAGFDIEIDTSDITKCARGILPSSAGYIWRYDE